MLSLLTSAIIAAASGVPMEPADGQFYLGAWYDRLHGDTPLKINERLGHEPLPFYQVDCNITETLQVQPIDDLINQVSEIGTDSFLYLTVYPYEGFDAVSDEAFSDFVAKMVDIVSEGHRILIRYASEMNGSWFRYGQQPSAFKREWIRLVTAVRNATSEYPDNIAFLWSPNDGSGYPFTGYGLVEIDPEDIPAMDTNGDGRVNAGDDPYSPYYPGDEYVDWVGMSIYHYSNEFPYGVNDIPASSKFEDKLTGVSVEGNFNVYEMFSGSGAGGQPASVSAGGKPFMVAETAATTFVAVRNPVTDVWTQPDGIDPVSRRTQKQAWWRQYLDPALRARYPRLKGASLFEFSKPEDSEFRVFNTLGWSTNQTIPIFGGLANQNETEVVLALRDDLNGIYGEGLVWGKSSSSEQELVPTSSPSADSESSALQKTASLSCLLALFAMVF